MYLGLYLFFLSFVLYCNTSLYVLKIIRIFFKSIKRLQVVIENGNLLMKMVLKCCYNSGDIIIVIDNEARIELT